MKQNTKYTHKGIYNILIYEMEMAELHRVLSPVEGVQRIKTIIQLTWSTAKDVYTNGLEINNAEKKSQRSMF